MRFHLWWLAVPLLLALPTPAEAQPAGALVGVATLPGLSGCVGLGAGAGVVEVKGAGVLGSWRMHFTLQQSCASVLSGAPQCPNVCAFDRTLTGAYAGPWNPTLGGCLPAALPSVHGGYLCLSAVPFGAGSALAKRCTSPWAGCDWSAVLKTVRA